MAQPLAQGSDRGPAAYRHRQFGTVIAAASVAAMVLATWIGSRANAPGGRGTWTVDAIAAVVFALFGWLVVDVSVERVEARFGIGVVRRRIDVADIVGCERVRTRFWWGWGLHWTPSGWLYNVSGRDAVRVELRSGRAVMIGSDDAQALVVAIEAAREARKGRR